MGLLHAGQRKPHRGHGWQLLRRRPVWAGLVSGGGYNTSRIERTCEVPADRHLFFPVINVVQMLYPATEADCPAIMAEAAQNNDSFV